MDTPPAPHPQPPGPPSSAATLTVRDLVGDPVLDITLTVVGGDRGLDRAVRSPRIQKSGLALAGHFHGIDSGRIQILGMTEITYLASLTRPKQAGAVQRFFERDLCCVIVADCDTLLRERDTVMRALVPAADDADTPLLCSPARSSQTILALHTLLDERLAPRARVHGVLVDVFEIGLLLLGSSGVGKSEVALELVMRGHRLVADDVVECHYRPPGMVFGSPADLLRHHLEVRGLGILNIKDLFGVTAVRDRKRVDVVVRLADDESDVEIDRLGLDERFHEILGVSVPELAIPVRPGRDTASILEIAARNELLKQAGHHPAKEFFGRIEGALRPSGGVLFAHESEFPRARTARHAPATGGDVGPPPESSVGLPRFPRRR
jgi:HPr kinase/phosphorylase